MYFTKPKINNNLNDNEDDSVLCSANSEGLSILENKLIKKMV